MLKFKKFDHMLIRSHEIRSCWRYCVGSLFVTELSIEVNPWWGGASKALHGLTRLTFVGQPRVHGVDTSLGGVTLSSVRPLPCFGDGPRGVEWPPP